MFSVSRATFWPGEIPNHRHLEKRDSPERTMIPQSLQAQTAPICSSARCLLHTELQALEQTNSIRRGSNTSVAYRGNGLTSREWNVIVLITLRIQGAVKSLIPWQHQRKKEVWPGESHHVVLLFPTRAAKGSLSCRKLSEGPAASLCVAYTPYYVFLAGPRMERTEQRYQKADQMQRGLTQRWQGRGLERQRVDSGLWGFLLSTVLSHKISFVDFNSNQ